MRNLPWPEMNSAASSGRTIREILDYLLWISREMRQLGFHAGSDRDSWCRRVHRAYAALFMPVVPGHGDPYPPDVPPARNPGIWPDIPAAVIPGMTVRHQLTVTEMLVKQLRDQPWPHARADQVAEWDRRLDLAFQALDHGESPAMPEDARTEASEKALAEAEAARKALQAKARRRSRQLRKQFTASRKKTTAKKKATGKAKAAAKKKKASPKKAKKKATAKKKTAKRKAAKKAKKKTTTRKRARKK